MRKLVLSSVPCLFVKIQFYVHWHKDDYEIFTREHSCSLPNNAGMDPQIINNSLCLRKESSPHLLPSSYQQQRMRLQRKFYDLLFMFFWWKSQVKGNIISLKYELKFLVQMGIHHCALYLVFCLVLFFKGFSYIYIIFSFYSFKLMGELG